MENEVVSLVDLKDEIGSICESNIKKNKIELYNSIIKYRNYNKLNNDKWYLLIYKYYNNIVDNPKCLNSDCCNEVKFIDSINGFRDFCSRKCMYNSDKIKKQRKDTCMDKYGVDNPSKLKSVRDKIEQTNIDKYGVKYPLMSSAIVDKYKKTMNHRYGVDNPSYLDEFKDKRIQTMNHRYGVDNYSKTDEFIIKSKETKRVKYNDENYNNRKLAINTSLERYGVDNYTKTDEYKIKSKETNLKKYGVDNYTKTDEYKIKSKETCLYNNKHFFKEYGYDLVEYLTSDLVVLNCDNCNDNFEITKQLFRKRMSDGVQACTICNSKSVISSKHEYDISDFIKLNTEKCVLESDRSILNGKELDIYLPDLNIAFEFNGLYWHSELYKDKNYHLDKTNECLENDIQLIHIYEDDWLYKKDIVKSRILNLIGETPKRIYARKCVIKEISNNKLVRKFLEDNHIQGFVGSKVKIGLFYDNELVSLMTFGNLRKNLGQKSKEGNWELLRFCNKLNTSVVGGASKLFKHFINNYEYESIISYADRSWSKGGLYEKLGFDKISETEPNYYYIKDKMKHNRFKFRKDKLISDGFDKNKTEHEIMFERGYYRIYDSGSYKYKYIKKT